MMTDEKQIEAVAKVIQRSINDGAVLYRGIHNEPRIMANGWAKDIMIDCDIVAQAAIEASHAKYVPELVEALQDVLLSYEVLKETYKASPVIGGVIGGFFGNCVKAKQALAKLPEESRG